jgi:hypothetical protein
MVREFKFFRGYKQNTLTEQWEDIFRTYPPTPGTGIINWGTTTTNPAWIVNPGLVQYATSTYTIPDYTITTTPGTGTYTIPFSGTINTATTGFSLTTSNTTGTVTTTGGIGGAFTTTGTISTNTFYTSNIK